MDPRLFLQDNTQQHCRTTHEIKGGYGLISVRIGKGIQRRRCGVGFRLSTDMVHMWLCNTQQWNYVKALRWHYLT